MAALKKTFVMCIDVAATKISGYLFQEEVRRKKKNKRFLKRTKKKRNNVEYLAKFQS